MSLEETRDKVKEVLAELDVLLNSEVPTKPVVPVEVGMNLPSLMANSLPDTIFKIAKEYTYSGDIKISKPCTLVNQRILEMPYLRVDDSLNGPTLNSHIKLEAPGIMFSGIRVQGTNRDRKIIMAYDDVTEENLPKNLTFDRCAILGSPAGQRCGIAMNTSGFTIVKSHVGNCWYQGQDSQAIGSERGMINALIDDCFLEGSGENFITGGGDLLREELIPSDIEIRNSHFYKPLTWKDKPGSVKNLFEIKAGKRIKVKNCIFENNWKDSQGGLGMLFNVRNQYGRDDFVTISDILIEDCILKNSSGGVAILGRDNIKGTKPTEPHYGEVYPSIPSDGITFKNFKILQLNADRMNGRAFQIQGGPQNLTLDTVVMERDPGITTKDPINCFMLFGERSFKSDGLIVSNCTFIEGEYGLKGDDVPPGFASLEAYSNRYTWVSNKVMKSGYRNIPYPVGTTLV